jgi:hypothetical protein
MLDKSREYVHPAWFVLLCVIFIPLVMPHWAAAQSSASGSQTTRLMQQMDYRQRVDEQRAEANRLKASPLPPAEDASIALDYVILAVLVGSTAALLVISRMKRRPRLARRYPPYCPPR